MTRCDEDPDCVARGGGSPLIGMLLVQGCKDLYGRTNPCIADPLDDMQKSQDLTILFRRAEYVKIEQHAKTCGEHHSSHVAHAGDSCCRKRHHPFGCLYACLGLLSKCMPDDMPRCADQRQPSAESSSWSILFHA